MLFVKLTNHVYQPKVLMGKVLSGVTMSIHQEAGSFGGSDNAELSTLTSTDTSNKYPAT